MCRCPWVVRTLLLGLACATIGLYGPSSSGQIPTVAGIGGTGQILVRIREAGSPFAGQATIALHSPSQLTNTTTSSYDAGQAKFTGLNSGQYLVEVSAPGYRTVQQEAVLAADGETEYLEVEMIPLRGAGESPTPGGAILSPKPLKELEKGLKALQAEKLDQAEVHLRKAQRAAPGYPDVNYLLGVLWLRRHDGAQARTYLEKAVQLSPKHASALLALGEAEYLQRDYSKAIDSLQKSVSMNPAWRAYWLAGVASYQQGQYGKSREFAEEALRVGQEMALPARLLLGEALAAIGQWTDAITALEHFLSEERDGPQADTAKMLVAEVRQKQRLSVETLPAKAMTTPKGLSPTVTVGSSGTGLMPIVPLIETSWAPPDVDDEKPAVEAGSSCDLEPITESAGARVVELVKNVDRFTATEGMEHESLTALGIRTSSETRSFNYLVEIRKIGPHELDLREFRNGSTSLQPFPGHLATVGAPMLALVFHPYYREEFEFRCEGKGAWRGRPAWVVHFRQRHDQMNEMRLYRVGRRSFPVPLKGRAWIDSENSQILAMEADMIRSVPEIRLLRDHQLIEYGPVEFRKANEQMWLPKSADWYCNLADHRYHRRHTFSKFLLFSWTTPRKSRNRKLRMSQAGRRLNQKIESMK